MKLGLHMQKLGYCCLALLDTDVVVSAANKQKFEEAGGLIAEWADNCDIERRIFLDVPWATVREIVDFALETSGEGRVLSNLRLADKSTADIDRAALDALPESDANREWLASAAILKVERKSGGKEDRSWFKNMTHGEQLGRIVFGCLPEIPQTPLAKTINEVRHWVDA